MSGIDLTPDLLATQGRALRGLACSLLGDAHAAEDVVQETWLACLKHPGALPERVSAWLGTVTKHLALHRLRGDGRRAVRERSAAAPERLEALQQRILEREEALRAVTQALLALEEPYKTALLLRFYEDCTPAEIAAELGLPPSTVKSRLARGLERLRAKLGSEFDGDETRRTRALRGLAGLPAPSGAIASAAAPGSTAATIGTLALATKLQLAAGAIALAGGALWWWNRAPEERVELAREAEPAGTRPASAALAASSPAEPLAPATARPEKTAGQRESVATAVRTSESEALDSFPTETSFPYLISGQVRDELDLPLPGARVFLGPHGFPLNRVAVTDDEGRFSFAFDARRPAFECAFTVDDRGGRMLGLRELRLVSGSELVVDVGLNPLSNRGTPLVEMRGAEVVLSAQERGVPVEPRLVYDFGGADEEIVSQAASILSERVRFAARSISPLECAPDAARRSDGRGIFVAPPPSLACERVLDFDLGEGVPSVFVSRRAAAAVGFDLSFGALSGREPTGEPPEQATLRGVVRDASGNGVPGAEVRWAVPGGAFEMRVSAGDDGAFTLLGVAPGEVVLRAGGGDQGVARERITLAPGQDLAWSPVLARGDEVAGRVVLVESENTLSGVLVELWSVSPSFLWCDATLTDQDGRFAIPNVPAGALELHVYASGVMNPPSAFPIRIVRPVFAPGDLGEIVLGVNDLVSSSLALTVLDPRGDPLPGAEVRVWQGMSGRGCFAGEADETGKLVLAGLPHGSYRVEVGGPFGWRDLGTIWVDEDTELAPERCAAPGFAQLRVVSGGLPAPSVSLWSAHPDVFGQVDASQLAHFPQTLRAGDYVLCAAAGKERVSETALRIEPGAMNALALEVSPSGPIRVRPDVLDPALDAGARDERCSACHATAADGLAR